jgi:hypothetical protein
MSPPGVRALTLPEVPVTGFEEIVCCATQRTSSRKSWCFKTILLKGLRTPTRCPPGGRGLALSLELDPFRRHFTKVAQAGQA